MEAAVEQLPDHSDADSVKLSEVGYQTSNSQAEENPKPNGVTESDNVTVENVDLPSEKIDANGDSVTITEPIANNSVEKRDTTETQLEITTVEGIDSNSVSADDISAPDEQENAKMTSDIEKTLGSPHLISSSEPENQRTESVVNEIRIEEVVVETTINAESVNENMQFETKVVVESNDTNEIDMSANSESAHNILNEMNQNIELSEVLCSSDVTDNVENNNCSIRQEMFNKEELLDILEGNDVHCSEHQVKEREIIESKETEINREMALKQLTRLKKVRKPLRKIELLPIPKKKNKTKKVVEISNEDNIVNALVKDWDDEIEEEDALDDNDISSIESEQVLESTPNAIKDKKRASIDSVTSDGQTSILNKSGDDSQPQRRLGRVIKKKVIFDPDNPDTFTKGKVHTKSREPQTDKDQPPSKKVKAEPIAQRAKSKSPTSKLQWKKPSSKNSKQNKRLSEVDRLLMDEGAVNMIYQLTPEAPKGKKNMRTKAEFIKKIQSTTPESKEMKFRERKKELKGEDGEPKKILGGKHRTSLSSSVQSPSMCEDFENHSADDSIIYRRHSSSSYSSSCLSPRRLSDMEASINQNSNVLHQALDNKLQLLDESSSPQAKDVKHTPAKEIINKDDCLSIKKKLNSKLSLALNKRKKDMGKSDKSLKKQVKSSETEVKNEIGNYKNLTVKCEHRIAEICIKNTNTKFSLENVKEVMEALSYVDLRTDTSVTLLTSECGTLCSELDFRPSLNNDLEVRQKAANEITESLRSLLWAVGQHSKLLCVAVGNACAGGIAVALVAMADMSLAAEGATFALSHDPSAPPAPGIAALITSHRQLPQALINDMVLFGRRLSSFEALQGGLVSRVLCNAGFSAQVQAVVSEIANQPMEVTLTSGEKRDKCEQADAWDDRASLRDETKPSRYRYFYSILYRL
ncbi:hypothetical protein evm_006698 [Chilo suppressalis]|nr:hypothetical protein evm_006698 [Chilo suppressalis]